MAAATAAAAMTAPPASQKKVFVGGLSWETDEQSLRDYFARYGAVSDCVIMRDRLTGHPRGFGFVTYDDQLVAERVAAEFHELDGRQVEAKMAVPRSECVPAARTNVWRATKKVFVGGLPAACREAELHAHFIQYGDIAECQVMYDHQTGNSRGFGFVTFTAEATVDRVVDIELHEIMAKQVEVKRAEPKQALEARRAREAAAAAAAATGNALATSPAQGLAHAPPPSAAGFAASSSPPPPGPLPLSAPLPAAKLDGAARPPPDTRFQSAPSSLPFSRGGAPSAAAAAAAARAFQTFGGPWASLFPAAAGAASSSWAAPARPGGFGGDDAAAAAAAGAAAAAALSVSASGSASAPSMHGAAAPAGSGSGTGLFAPVQAYAPDLAQCAYAALYGRSAPDESFVGDVLGGLASARMERRFHPYSTRERVERSYR